MIQKIHSLIRRNFFSVLAKSRIHALSSGHTIQYLSFCRKCSFLKEKEGARREAEGTNRRSSENVADAPRQGPDWPRDGADELTACCQPKLPLPLPPSLPPPSLPLPPLPSPSLPLPLPTLPLPPQLPAPYRQFSLTLSSRTFSI